jgi:hypothetical protein
MVLPKGLLNHSYMHGLCGSISTQYAVNPGVSATRKDAYSRRGRLCGVEKPG